MPIYMNVDDLIEAVTNPWSWHSTPNWLTLLRHCNVLIHSQVQSPSHFHQLAGVSLPASPYPFVALPPHSPQSHLSFLLFFSTALYSQSLPFTLTNIPFSPLLLVLSVSPRFFHCAHYSSSLADTAKVDGTFFYICWTPAALWLHSQEEMFRKTASFVVLLFLQLLWKLVWV